MLSCAAQDVPTLELVDLELPPLGALLAEQSVLTMPTSTLAPASASAAGCAGLWADSCIASNHSEHDAIPVTAPQQIQTQTSSHWDVNQSSEPESPLGAALAGVAGAAQLSNSVCTQQGQSQREQCQRPAELPLPNLGNAFAGPHSYDAVPAAAAAAAAAASPALLMPAIGKDAATSPPRGCGTVTLP